jgi:hypothetical protein
MVTHILAFWGAVIIMTHMALIGILLCIARMNGHDEG